MSAHALWATSGCQSLLLVEESVNHHASTPPKRSATAPTLRQNGLTNISAAADAITRSPATTLFAFPNGASNQTAPNAQAIAMIAVRRTSSSPIQRITRTRFFIMNVPNSRGEERGFRLGSVGLIVELEKAMDRGNSFGIER